MRYGALVEKTKTGFSAYVPDLPGCVAAGKTRQQVRRRLQEAVEIHLKSMMESGDAIPEPTSKLEYVEVQLGLITPMNILIAERWRRLRYRNCFSRSRVGTQSFRIPRNTPSTCVQTRTLLVVRSAVAGSRRSAWRRRRNFAIGRAGVGVDNIDLDAEATAAGVLS